MVVFVPSFVPSPFADLSGRKRRPALVVSPGRFHPEDMILCAITSRVPRTPAAWDVLLEANNMVEEELPRRSVVKVGKLFAMHRSLISGHFGSVDEPKLREVLGKLRELFAPVDGPAKPDAPGDEPEMRTEKVAQAALALLHLNVFSDKHGWRAWKAPDRHAMDRLHEKGLIDNPESKAKSVALTEEAARPPNRPSAQGSPAPDDREPRGTAAGNRASQGRR